jgi:hypothetical protein
VTRSRSGSIFETVRCCALQYLLRRCLRTCTHALHPAVFGARFSFAVELVIGALREITFNHFAGAEALLHAVTNPVYDGIVAYLPAAMRASAERELHTADLQLLPSAVLSRVARLCRAQLRSFVNGTPERAPRVDDHWQLEEGHGAGEGALLPTDALLCALAASDSGSTAAAVDASAAADRLLAWVRGDFMVADAARIEYPPAQTRAAALRTCAATGRPLPLTVLAARFHELLNDASARAEDRLDLGRLERLVKQAHARLVRDFHARPSVSRRAPVTGDLAGASLALMRAVLEWEDALCNAMVVRHEVDVTLGAWRARVASDTWHVAVNDAAASDYSVHELDAALDATLRDGFMPQTAAQKEHVQLLAQQQRVAVKRAAEAHDRADAAEACTREASHAGQASLTERDSLVGWRGHVRHAADALARAAAAPEGSPHHLEALSIAAALFKNKRAMFHHDEHFHAVCADLSARVHERATMAEQLQAVTWRLGEQILDFACNDGDTFIGTHLARPLLLRRLAAGIAGSAQRHADDVAAQLLAEEAEVKRRAAAAADTKRASVARRKARRRGAGDDAAASDAVAADASAPPDADAPAMPGDAQAAPPPEDRGAAAAAAGAPHAGTEPAAAAASPPAPPSSALSDAAEAALLAALAHDDASALAEALATHSGACGDEHLLRDATAALERLLLAQEASVGPAHHAPPPVPLPEPPPAAAPPVVAPPPPPAPPEEPADDVTCVVCLCERKTCVLLPCRHLCACDGCAAALAAAPPARALCPVCRAPIQSTFSVFV